MVYTMCGDIHIKETKMKNRKFITTVAALTIASAMMIAGGCSKEETSAEETTTATTAAEETAAEAISEVLDQETESEPEVVIETEYESPTGMKDGDQFEATIMLEGMEETVTYSHVINSGVGFEMDYESDSLNRISEANKETFVSVYEDQSNPQIYLEVKHDSGDAASVAAATSELLSGSYELTQDTLALDNAGSCTWLKGSSTSGEGSIVKIYIIPAGNGSVVATAHYTAESEEGWGSRFAEMVKTIIIIDGSSVNNSGV